MMTLIVILISCWTIVLILAAVAILRARYVDRARKARHLAESREQHVVLNKNDNPIFTGTYDECEHYVDEITWDNPYGRERFTVMTLKEYNDDQN